MTNICEEHMYKGRSHALMNCTQTFCGADLLGKVACRNAIVNPPQGIRA